MLDGDSHALAGLVICGVLVAPGRNGQAAVAVTRVYRMPSEKDSQFATTGVQANFETYTINSITGQRAKTGNGHLNVTK